MPGIVRRVLAGIARALHPAPPPMPRRGLDFLDVPPPQGSTPPNFGDPPPEFND